MRKIAVFAAVAACAAAFAAGGKVKSDVRRTPYQGAISVDAASGKVIFEDRADAKCCPASVTKLMTLLLVLEDMHAMKYSTVDEVTATVRCTREKPSVCGLKPGMKMSVDELLFAMLVHSANDAAVLLAEYTMKTIKNREGQPVKFLNHNNILRMDKKKIVNANGESEVDGLKTGYAEYCGSSIILTGKRDGRRAIVVVVGSETSKLRDEHARRLMVAALDEVSLHR